MGILRRLRTIFKWMVVAFFGTTILAVVLLRFVPVYFTPLMFIRLVEQGERGESLKLHHRWVPLEDMSPYLPQAVMAGEDAKFLSHHGFDFGAIEQAAKSNIRSKGKRKVGASTISQQTAKNVFLWPGRTWVRKGLEAYFTALIELMWSKQRIMEVYLNSIEMGDGIYGASAVAEWHFGTTAKDLTRSQCALIAASLPNPLVYDSSNPGNYLSKRKRRIMHEMKFVKRLPPEGSDTADR